MDENVRLLVQEGSAAVVGANLEDPLKEIRDLRRRARIGVYVAVTLPLPAIYFALSLNFLQIGVWFALAVVIATLAIELLSREGFRLRKRSAYPGALLWQLNRVESPAAAYSRALEILIGLLQLRGAFIALKEEAAADELSLAAMAGIDRLKAERFLYVGGMNVAEALQSGAAVPFRPPHASLAEASLDRGEALVFVPVLAVDKPLGILAVIGAGDNADLKDLLLLRAVGVGLGLCLQNLRQKEELREIAAVDYLTGIYNRRYFFEQLGREVAEARRYNSPLAVILVDLDGLKRLNDGYGHRAGDEALVSVAKRLLRQARATDIVARLGGDEFAVILPRSNSSGAQEMASRLSQAVAAQSFPLPDGTAIPLTISYGVASFPEDAEEIEELLREADASMYRAKFASRARGKVKT